MHRFITFTYRKGRILFQELFCVVFSVVLSRELSFHCQYSTSIHENNKDHEINLIDARDYLLSVNHMSISRWRYLIDNINDRVLLKRFVIELDGNARAFPDRVFQWSTNAESNEYRACEYRFVWERASTTLSLSGTVVCSSVCVSVSVCVCMFTPEGINNQWCGMVWYRPCANG